MVPKQRNDGQNAWIQPRDRHNVNHWEERGKGLNDFVAVVGPSSWLVWPIVKTHSRRERRTMTSSTVPSKEQKNDNGTASNTWKTVDLRRWLHWQTEFQQHGDIDRLVAFRRLMDFIRTNCCATGTDTSKTGKLSRPIDKRDLQAALLVPSLDLWKLVLSLTSPTSDAFDADVFAQAGDHSLGAWCALLDARLAPLLSALTASSSSFSVETWQLLEAASAIVARKGTVVYLEEVLARWPDSLAIAPPDALLFTSEIQHSDLWSQLLGTQHETNATLREFLSKVLNRMLVERGSPAWLVFCCWHAADRANKALTSTMWESLVSLLDTSGADVDLRKAFGESNYEKCISLLHRIVHAVASVQHVNALKRMLAERFLTWSTDEAEQLVTMVIKNQLADTLRVLMQDERFAPAAQRWMVSPQSLQTSDACLAILLEHAKARVHHTSDVPTLLYVYRMALRVPAGGADVFWKRLETVMAAQEPCNDFQAACGTRYEECYQVWIDILLDMLSKRRLDVVKRLLSAPFLPLIDKHCVHLALKAKVEDRCEVFRLLVQDERFSSYLRGFFKWICGQPDTSNIVEVLLGLDHLDLEEGLYRACCDSRRQTAELLLKKTKVDPSASNNRCFYIAYKRRDDRLLNLLLADARVWNERMCVSNWMLVKWAVKFHHKNILDRLLVHREWFEEAWKLSSGQLLTWYQPALPVVLAFTKPEDCAQIAEDRQRIFDQDAQTRSHWFLRSANYLLTVADTLELDADIPARLSFDVLAPYLVGWPPLSSS